ncbi:TetR/AcrR family transcriptional regulator [Nocardia sp. NPDC051052]|uniref:TetR/AcrR family transcriptional regulator n=1 Tax=Nocardia sp. NPDC051052 TaxID=3364322 RepID=UPI0037AC652D
MSEKQVDGRTLRYQHRRPELLQAATQYVLDHGVSDLSLRPMARDLGVSHATVIRHFATKDALIAEVLTTIRADFEARLLAETSREADSATAQIRALWQRLCEPKEQRQFLVLFELVAAAGYRDKRGTLLQQTLVTDWIALAAGAMIHYGWPAETASPTATLVLAQIRGLQIDLITTGDRERVDQAFELMLSMLEKANPAADRSSHR